MNFVSPWKLLWSIGWGELEREKKRVWNAYRFLWHLSTNLSWSIFFSLENAEYEPSGFSKLNDLTKPFLNCTLSEVVINTEVMFLVDDTKLQQFNIVYHIIYNKTKMHIDVLVSCMKFVLLAKGFWFSCQNLPFFNNDAHQKTLTVIFLFQIGLIDKI